MSPDSPFYVEWKKSGFCFPRRYGDHSFMFEARLVRTTGGVTQENFDTKSSNYIAFLIFSRTECGAAFVRALGEDQVTFGVHQRDNPGVEIYDHVYSYLRWTGEAARRSLTLQFSRILPDGMEDRDSNSNRDRAYITISNIIQDVAGSYKDDSFMKQCLSKVQVGVMIPGEGVSMDYDHARCVGEQKTVGF